MKITDLPTAELLRLIRASERASDPDEYALAVLRRELIRRLDLARAQDRHSTDKEVTSW
jgi:hypothetical protein